MNSQPLKQCDMEMLDALLCGTLSREEAAIVESHLSGCRTCAERIQLAAVPETSWDEAQSLLSLDEFDGLSSLAAASSLFPSDADEYVDSPTKDLLSREISGWLDPTDDPAMLGRFAGYEIVGIIGHGGMGIVLKGFERSLNRYVAIKILAPRLATNGSARKRFAREAQAAAAVRHDNVIAIHRVDEWHGLPFLTMPYVGGVSLQKRIDSEGPLSIEQTLRVGVQIAAGLAAAHAQGLVHRDIKPANILLEHGVERVTITDFGLARAADDASVTRTGVIAGTPQYMSPEQAEAKPLDARSDLFSLGSVMYVMATGRPPFRGEGSFDVLKRITGETARGMREIEPGIPVWFEELVNLLHAKAPDERPQSAEVVAELLEDCLAHVQQPTTVPLPQSCHSLRERSKPHQSPGISPRFPRKPPANAVRLIMGTAFSFLLIFAGILIVLELNKGKLTIESEVDGIPIRVMQGDKVAEKLTVTQAGASVRIAAGQYIVEIDGEINGITVEKGTVTLQRGGRETVRIVQEEHAPTVSDTANAVRGDVRGVRGSPRLQVKAMQVHVVDEQGKPIRNATVFRNHVYASGESPRHKIENAEFETDANGTAVISLTGMPHDLRLWATKDSFCPLHAMWAKKFQADGDTIPDEFTFVMRRGTTIGGIVVDATGRPIPDVRVEVRDMTVQDHNNSPDRPGKRPVGANMLAEDDAIVTNAMGYWELNNVPPDDVLLAGRNDELSDPDKPAQTKPLLNLRFIHPRYEENEWAVPQQQHDVTLESLRAKTARVVLPGKTGAVGEEEEENPGTVDSRQADYPYYTPREPRDFLAANPPGNEQRKFPRTAIHVIADGDKLANGRSPILVRFRVESIRRKGRIAADGTKTEPWVLSSRPYTGSLDPDALDVYIEPSVEAAFSRIGISDLAQQFQDKQIEVEARVHQSRLGGYRINNDPRHERMLHSMTVSSLSQIRIIDETTGETIDDPSP